MFPVGSFWDLHAKRVNSLCAATLGVLRSGSLAVCTVGQAYEPEGDAAEPVEEDDGRY
jgi:hypothetical protein